ncbi:uncharacterized protein E0L32_005610 [Thyridium curvatum]|uniref:Serine/threonine-protein kinase MEC1 n=1 Tax=Thyridium curvatum TaxID=1093900 RepID=A0A507BBD7_9PEZI|nr:uncharacterized protein E0L32_005610 [Thyridium curvatum]TPX13910.1 hypothetical protein E0L32_005610 [Thyridium curvatum]
MAPESHGRAGLPVNGLFSDNDDTSMPPPSTLAAQLVGNFSNSTRTAARSDETQELKRLFAIIEEVKDSPELLKTSAERIEHNHMLIYVYTRVALDGLKWDNPFASQATATAEALKAISFLRVTIKETPSVLNFCSEPGALLLRGREPLWVWMLPRILRMLGQVQCLDLTSAITSFCVFLFQISDHSGALWGTVPQLIRYYQTCFTAILNRIQELSPNGRDSSLSLSLPPSSFLAATLDISEPRPHACVYRLRSLSHALRHADSILCILADSMQTKGLDGSGTTTAKLHIPWVLDALFTFHHVKKSYRAWVPDLAVSALQSIFKLVSNHKVISRLDTALTQKGYTILAILCREVLEDRILSSDDEPGNHKPTSRFVENSLLGILDELARQHAGLEPWSDFQKCVRILRLATTGQTSSQGPDINLKDFKDVELLQYAGSLHLDLSSQEAAPRASQPPSKRQKVSGEADVLSCVISRTYAVLHTSPSNSTADLEGLILNGFPNMTDRDRCEVIDLLSRISCAADGTLTQRLSHSSKSSVFYCAHCVQEDSLASTSPKCVDIAAKSIATAIFTRLIQLPSFLESRRPRLVAMLALRRFVSHSKDLEFLDIETSGPGRWCLQSLSSSIRELRIAAGRALPSFLTFAPSRSIDDDLVRRNRANILSLLKSISDKNSPYLNESCIMAWVQVGKAVPDEELNLVLIQLLEFLGHRNQIVSACAFNEILSLASFRKLTPRKLFEPFWKSLAFLALKDMVARPQTTRLLAELLQMSVQDLVVHLQTHALPWLVLTRKKEVVQKIADFRGEKEAWMPCVDTVNLGSILALLLAQEEHQTEHFVMTLLRHISTHFNDSSLRELVGSEPVMTVLELLKAAAEADDSRRSRVRNALSIVADLLLTEPNESRRKKKDVARLLQQYALGITTLLSEVINDDRAKHPPVQEQRNCIRALEEMIRLSRSHIRAARPQISAFLLNALSYDQLRSAAFSCWATLLNFLDEEDVETLVETSFFIVGNYWNSFDELTREQCRKLLGSLLDRHSKVLAAKINELPSFGRIPGLADIEKKLSSFRQPLDNRDRFSTFIKRAQHENSGVVLQALNELADYLRENQEYLQMSAMSEQPDPVVTQLMRVLLDCSAKYNGIQPDITRLCVECIGLVGCLDSNRLETVRKQREFVVLHNFGDAEETTDFVLFILEEVLVKAFLSATDTNLQGFLSYAMQELLDRCDFRASVALQHGEGDHIYRKYMSLPEHVREVLTPFMTSRYRAQAATAPNAEYPIFRPGRQYGNWLRSFVLDLLHKGQNFFANVIFPPLYRVIRVKDLRVAEFLLPYLVVHVITGDESSEVQRKEVLGELLGILKYQPGGDASYAEREHMRMFCEAVFRVLDYAMRWLQLKSSKTGLTKGDTLQIARIKEVLDAIPADLISRRAVDCKQYARALFHLEPFISTVSQREVTPEDAHRLLGEIQYIYTQIDEPDGLDGITAHLTLFDLNQQVLSHRKAGRWTAAQTWYEVQLATEPRNINVQLDLLTCLKESGQYDVLLNHVEGMETTTATVNRIVPFAVEAAWATGRWDALQKWLWQYNAGDSADIFNLGIAQALLNLKSGKVGDFSDYLVLIRDKVAGSLSYSGTSSLQASHDAMLKAHILTDLEILVQSQVSSSPTAREATLATLDRRLEVLGAYVNDKQYVLGIRRAAMELMRPAFMDEDLSSLWLTTARLARKAGLMHQSFNAMLHAYKLGDESASVDNARLLWKDGHHRKAIQTLQSTMSRDFRLILTDSSGEVTRRSGEVTRKEIDPIGRKFLLARTHLLLAKWLDHTGQANASTLRQQYQQAAKLNSQWEKGHYYLGRHYKKVLESEKALKPDQQSDEYLSGETAKLVIENYLRSLTCGTKYLYQTLPRILTLWLELGSQVDKAPDGKVSLSRELHQRRKAQLSELHKNIYKAVTRIPAYIFYTTLPQLVARIAHPNIDVFKLLEHIIIKVVNHHPRQSLWSLFGVMTTKQPSERRTRGLQILHTLRNTNKKAEAGQSDIRVFLRMGEKLAEQLLLACNNGDFQSNRTTVASITRDLNFNHKCTPCPLVVPVECCLTATLPTLTDNVQKHKAFSGDLITIDSFLDEVLVLGSLAKPRKLTARGSDGKLYALMIKPKDDLRTDQRLMEFNGIINRSLKKDAESSRRQLYIKTYSVTPLNEECGIVEWVEGIKTLRDILLGLYKTRNIAPNYGHLAQLMKEAIISENNIRLFTESVLGMFPAVLPSWFISQFPHPSAWFAARLKYTRSCAVMSMVGTILGLGDRHGENVLLEEGNGGIFHVDFNCLFDKGLTFAQPERVPFRLTHNMVQAMGLYGYEGPFRRCSELTLTILRQQEETLMTILEAFIYDPTLDLQKDKKRKHELVKLNPQSVVESIKRKVRGLMGDESIPLGVEGQVEELIKQAVNPRNLAAMYIGWCPFL